MFISSSSLLFVLLVVVVLQTTIFLPSSSNSIPVAFVEAVHYIDCTSVSCTPYVHSSIPIYDHVSVINAPDGASFTFSNAFMNSIAFDTNLNLASVDINTMTLFTGNLEFAQAPTSTSITVTKLTTVSGIVTFPKSIGASSSLSVTNSKITLSTSSFLVQPHGIHIADEITALSGIVGTINIVSNTIVIEHLSPASSFSVSGIWVGKLTRAPNIMTISNNVITVDNTKAHGIYLSPTLAWQTNTPVVSINANTITAVHVKIGSGITFGTSYSNQFNLLSIQTNKITQNATSSVASDPDTDGSRFCGVDFSFCYVRAATDILISSNEMFLSDGDYTNGIRLTHAGDCGSFSVPARRLDSVTTLSLNSNKIQINATERAVAIQLGTQRTVVSRLALGSNSGATGFPSGRNLNLNNNVLTAKSHHVRGIDMWLWNVAGLDTFSVSQNQVSLTQEKSTDKTEDGSDVIASAYGIHLAFNDRFSNVFIDSLSFTQNSILIASPSQNSECSSRSFWYDYCWAEFAGVWIRWHASRAGGYSPRGSTVSVNSVDMTQNDVTFAESGSAFLHGVVFDHVNMLDVTADDASSVTYTPGNTITMSQNTLNIGTYFSLMSAPSKNSTLQNGIGFSTPIATFSGTQTLSQNTINFISPFASHVGLLSGAFKAISSCYSAGAVVVNQNTMNNAFFHSSSTYQGTACGVLVMRAGDGAVSTSGNTTISSNSLSLPDVTRNTANYFVGIAFVWSKNTPLLTPQDASGTAPTLSGTPTNGLVSDTVVSITSNVVSFSSSNNSALFASFTLRMDTPTPFSLKSVTLFQNIISSTNSFSSEVDAIPDPSTYASGTLFGQQTFLSASCKPFFYDLPVSSSVTLQNLQLRKNSVQIVTTSPSSSFLPLLPIFYVRLLSSLTSSIEISANTVSHTHQSGIHYNYGNGDDTKSRSSVLFDISSDASVTLPSLIQVYNNTFSGTFSSPTTSSSIPSSPDNLYFMNGMMISSPIANISFNWNRVSYTTSNLLIPKSTVRPIHFSCVRIEAAAASELVTSQNLILATGSSSHVYSAALVGMNIILHQGETSSSSSSNDVLSYTSIDDRLDIRGSGSVISALNISEYSLLQSVSHKFFISLNNISTGATALTPSEVEVDGNSVVSTVIFPSVNLSDSTIVCDRCYFWSVPNKIFTSPFSYFALGWFSYNYLMNQSVLNSPLFSAEKSYNSLIPFTRNTTFDANSNITFSMSKFNAFCIEYKDVMRAFSGLIENGGTDTTVNVTSACSGTMSKSFTFPTETFSQTDDLTKTPTTFSRTPPPTRTMTRSKTRSNSSTRSHTYYPGIITEPYPVTSEGVYVATALLAGFTAPASLLQIGALVSLMECGQAKNAAMRIALTPVYADGLFDEYIPSPFWLGQAFLIGGIFFLHFMMWLFVLMCGQLCQPEALARSFDFAEQDAETASSVRRGGGEEVMVLDENGNEVIVEQSPPRSTSSCCCTGCVFCTTRSRLAAMRVRFPHWTMWALNWLLIGWVYESGLFLFNQYPNDTTQYLKLGLSLIAPVFAIIHVILVFFFSWRARRAHENGDMWCVYGQRRKALQTEEEKLDSVLQTEMTRNMANESRRVSPRSSRAVATYGFNTPRRSTPNNNSIARSDSMNPSHIIARNSPSPYSSRGPSTPIDRRSGSRDRSPSAAAGRRTPQGLVRTPSEVVHRNSGGNHDDFNDQNERRRMDQLDEIYNTPARFSAHYHQNNNNNIDSPNNYTRSRTTRASLAPINTDIHTPNLPSPGRAPTPGGRRRLLRGHHRGGGGGCCSCCCGDDDYYIPGDPSSVTYTGQGATVCCEMNGGCWKATLPIGYWATHLVVSAERAHNQQYGICYYEYLPSVLPWIPFFESVIRLLAFPLVAAIQDNCSVVAYPLTILAFFCFAGSAIVRPNRAGIIDFFHTIIWLLVAILTLTNSFPTVFASLDYQGIFYALCGVSGLGIIVYLFILLLELGVWRPEWERENSIDEELVSSLESIDAELSRDITLATGQTQQEMQEAEAYEKEMQQLEEERKRLEAEAQDEEMREKLAGTNNNNNNKNNRNSFNRRGSTSSSTTTNSDIDFVLGKLNSARSNSSLKNIKRSLVGGDLNGITARGANGAEYLDESSSSNNSNAPSSVPNTGRGTISGDEHKQLSGMRKQIDGSWAAPDGKQMRYNWWETRGAGANMKNGDGDDKKTNNNRRPTDDLVVEDLEEETNRHQQQQQIDPTSPYSNSKARQRDEEIMRMKNAGSAGRFSPGSLHPSQSNSARRRMSDSSNRNNQNRNEEEDEASSNYHNQPQQQQQQRFVARLDGGYIGLTDNNNNQSSSTTFSPASTPPNLPMQTPGKNNNNSNNNNISHTLKGGEIRANANINNPNENVRRSDPQFDSLVARVGEQVHQSRYDRLMKYSNNNNNNLSGSNSPTTRSPEAEKLAIGGRGRTSPAQEDLPRQLNTGMAEFVDDPKNPRLFNREKIRAPYDTPQLERDRNRVRSQTNYASPSRVDATAAFGRRGQLQNSTPQTPTPNPPPPRPESNTYNNNNHEDLVPTGSVFAGRRRQQSATPSSSSVSISSSQPPLAYNAVNNSGRYGNGATTNNDLDSARRRAAAGETNTFTIPTSSDGTASPPPPVRRPSTMNMNNNQDPHDRTNYTAEITPDSLMRESKPAATTGDADVLTLPNE